MDQNGSLVALPAFLATLDLRFVAYPERLRDLWHIQNAYVSYTHVKEKENVSLEFFLEN